MKYITRSNVVGVLSGIIVIAMQLYGGYEEFWWYDNLAHLAGGISIAGIAARKDTSVYHDVGIALGAGIAWELFEFVHGIRPFQPGTDPDRMAEDTLLDTIFVCIGGYAVSRWFK